MDVFLSKLQQGAGMIEVMVTVLILAIGFLGLASLQIHSLRYGYEAYLQTQSSILAADMADRLRINHLEALNTSSYMLEWSESPAGGLTACEVKPCSASNLAQYDLVQWSRAVKKRLPGGQGMIAPSPKTKDGKREYKISIRYSTTDTKGDTRDKASAPFVTEIAYSAVI